jgi:alkyldihydroxyacetonephosphate synthase
VGILDILVQRLPPGAVVTDAEILRARATDCWALALLRRARGDALAMPAAVVYPASTEEVAAVMTWASETRVAVIPRGGGSGVCGGAEADAGSVILDLSQMNKIIGLDLVSQVVHVQAGVHGGQLEDALAGYGLTVGHYPQSIAASTVGGWIAASSAGQASTGFGTIEDALLGLTAVLSHGEILRCRPVPGTLAVVTEAALACRARPDGWQWLVFGFPSFAALADGLREAVRAETGAAIIRGYDEADAQLSFGALGHSGGCVGMLGFPAGLAGLEDRKRLAVDVVCRAGASDELSSSYGEHWWEHRNDAVATYQRIMGPDRAFGAGVVVDTMEVAGLWSAVPQLYAGIRGALAAHAEAVGCHLSHLYRSGSSLYFTFLVRGSDDHDAEARYLAAWDQAAGSCAAMGGTLSHHHGVGRLKSRFLATELGGTGVDVLARIKAALDPEGIMNPGVLLP